MGAMTPRPRNFDEATALQSAKEFFWTQGFEATSIQNLVDSMNIGRQSLYNTFGDKRTLFLRTLDLYNEELQEAALTPLNRPDAAMAEIAIYLRSVASSLTGQAVRRSCFLMNSVLELAATDEEVRKVASQFRASLVAALELALVRSAEQGTLKPGSDPEVCAQIIANTAMGMSLAWKSGGIPEELSSIVEGTIALVAKEHAPVAHS